MFWNANWDFLENSEVNKKLKKSEYEFPPPPAVPHVQEKFFITWISYTGEPVQESALKLQDRSKVIKLS